jgi:hypothetical protein
MGFKVFMVVKFELWSSRLERLVLIPAIMIISFYREGGGKKFLRNADNNIHD